MRPLRPVRTLCLVALCHAAVACADADDSAIMERDTFVDALVDLRASAAAVDSQDFAPVRDSILELHGVDSLTVQRYVAALSDDPQVMAELWKQIDARLKARADSIRRLELERDSADRG